MIQENSFYFSEINKIPLLSLEEEKALATKAFSGDQKAQKKLVEANLRIVLKVANSFRGYMDFEDLVEEGNLGLMHAAEKFNPEAGTRFITYAVWWIRSYIEKGIRDTATGVRFPAQKYEEMKLPKWKTLSLDKPINGIDDEEVSLGSILSNDKNSDPESLFLKKEADKKLREYLSGLNPREQNIIIKRFGLNGEKTMSLSEIGETMGFSKERIRQIEKRALSSLRNSINSTKNGYDFGSRAA